MQVLVEGLDGIVDGRVAATFQLLQALNDIVDFSRTLPDFPPISVIEMLWVSNRDDGLSGVVKPVQGLDCVPHGDHVAFVGRVDKLVHHVLERVDSVEQ